MISDCCGAVVHYQDICPRCGEHCEDASDDSYDAARDAYDMGYGMPVSDRQRREYEEEIEWDRQCRRGW